MVATDLNNWLETVEGALVQQHGITTDPEDLAEQNIDLSQLKKEHNLSKKTADKLRVALVNLPDVDLTETYKIIEHWEEAGIQLQGRVPKIKSSMDKIIKLRGDLTRELEWFSQSYSLLKNNEVLPDNISDRDGLLGLYTVGFSSFLPIILHLLCE